MLASLSTTASIPGSNSLGKCCEGMRREIDDVTIKKIKNSIPGQEKIDSETMHAMLIFWVSLHISLKMFITADFPWPLLLFLHPRRVLALLLTRVPSTFVNHRWHIIWTLTPYIKSKSAFSVHVTLFDLLDLLMNGISDLDSLSSFSAFLEHL